MRTVLFLKTNDVPKNITSKTEMKRHRKIENIECIGINLTKEVKYLYTKICKTFNFSIEKDTNK